MALSLDDPAGNTWTMKGYEFGLKPQHTDDQLVAAGAGNFKKLPRGGRRYRDHNRLRQRQGGQYLRHRSYASMGRLWMTAMRRRPRVRGRAANGGSRCEAAVDGHDGYGPAGRM
ncbi:MAG: hypothetical protein ABIR94_12605 [Rubrivivax sp.]